MPGKNYDWRIKQEIEAIQSEGFGRFPAGRAFATRFFL